MFKENFFKTGHQQKVDDKKTETENNRESEFLMTMTELDSFRNPTTKTPEKSEKLERLNQRIDEVVAGGHAEIFKKLAEAKKEGSSKSNLLSEEIDELFENYPLDVKLIDLPESLLGKILKPMSKEIRQAIYVQRDKRTLEEAMRLYRNWTKDAVIAYHVSDREIKNGFLQPGHNESAVYFSTDIERLFNLKSAKYIYAFRLNKDKVDKYRYGALDCFGKMEMQNQQGVEIEDMVSIFNQDDPAYRQRVLDNLGAKFAENYHAASDTADAFLKNHAA